MTCQRRSAGRLRRLAKFQCHKAIPHHHPALVSVHSEGRNNRIISPLRLMSTILCSLRPGGSPCLCSALSTLQARPFFFYARRVDFYASVKKGSFHNLEVLKTTTNFGCELVAVKGTSDKFGLKLCWDMQAAERTQGENEANTSRNKHICSRLLRIIFFSSPVGTGGTFFRKSTCFCEAVHYPNHGNSQRR